MDPRAKTLLVLGATVWALGPPSLVLAALHTGLLAALCLLTLGPRGLLRPLLGLAPLLLFVVILTPLFHPQGLPLIVVVGRPLLTDRGLGETARLLCRLLSIVLAFHLYVRGTDIEEIVAAARWFGLPATACLVLGVVVRLVPGVAQMYRSIAEAHGLRRPPPGAAGRGVAAAIRRTVPVLGAVLVHSVKGIPVLAMTMESRGVGRRNPRSVYRALPPAWRMLRDLAIGLLVLGLPQALVVAL